MAYPKQAPHTRRSPRDIVPETHRPTLLYQANLFCMYGGSVQCQEDGTPILYAGMKQIKAIADVLGGIVTGGSVPVRVRVTLEENPNPFAPVLLKEGGMTSEEAATVLLDQSEGDRVAAYELGVTHCAVAIQEDRPKDAVGLAAACCWMKQHNWNKKGYGRP